MRASAPGDPRPALLAVAVAHQARIAAERAATARDIRDARAARSACDSVDAALIELERLVLPDRATWMAARAQRVPLAVPGTVTPSERAWVLCRHLIVAAARVHDRASASGRPIVGERATSVALAQTDQALREIEPLVPPDRRLDLSASLSPAGVTLEAQLRLFAPVLAGRGP